MDNNAKYFFISAKGLKFKTAETASSEDIEDVLKSLSLDGKSPEAKSPSVSTIIDISSVMEAPDGMFIPSYFESYLKDKTGMDQVVIHFVREMSHAEYIADSTYRSLTAIKENKTPPAVSNNVLQEIDDILNLAEKGDLRVIKPDEPDRPLTEQEQTLKDMGLSTDLFDDSGLWEDEDI